MCPQVKARPVLAGRCQSQPDVAVFPRPRSSIHDADPLRAIAQWISQMIRLRPPQPSSNTAKSVLRTFHDFSKWYFQFLAWRILKWAGAPHRKDRVAVLLGGYGRHEQSHCSFHDRCRETSMDLSKQPWFWYILIKMCFAWSNSNMAWSSFSAPEWIVLTVNSHFMSVQSKEEMTLNMLKHVKTI